MLIIDHGPLRERLQEGKVTGAQVLAILDMAKQYVRPGTLRVGPASFDLPDNYVTFCVEQMDCTPLYGGIDAEGRVST